MAALDKCAFDSAPFINKRWRTKGTTLVEFVSQFYRDHYWQIETIALRFCHDFTLANDDSF